MSKNEGTIEVEFVVRKNPKEKAYVRKYKSGRVKFVKELTQEQIDSLVKHVAEVHRIKQQAEEGGEV